MTLQSRFTSLLTLMLVLILPMLLPAQRGNITIPAAASITVPDGAQLCADTIFANGTGHGTLTVANSSCLCSGAVIIPVEMLTFSATLDEGIVRLSWTTATETRNFGFEVQRQSSKYWNVLGVVEGSGTTTSEQTYRFTDLLHDVSPDTRTLRYRLKQIDLDGQYAYSPVVEIHRTLDPTRFSLSHYPTPCDDELTIRLELGTRAATSLRLYNLIGQSVMDIAPNALLEQGSHSYSVGTANLPSGLYLLVIDLPGRRRTAKVTIRH